MAVALRSTSSSVVAQLLMLMRIARRPRHTVGPHQQALSIHDHHTALLIGPQQCSL
jgi:hypothetical protein